MAEKIVSVKIVLVNKTTEEWGKETTVPYKSCMCIEFTPNGKSKLKIGDGVNTFDKLDYVGGELTGTGEELTATAIIAALGYTPIDIKKIGIANGIASLGENGKIPTEQLPIYDNGEIVEVEITESEKNGYINVNGTDIKVYEPEQGSIEIDSELSEISENAISNKAVTVALKDKFDVNDSLVLNCTL